MVYSENEALKGVNLAVNGENVVLVGLTGSGKSTLSKVILGFSPYSLGQYQSVW